VGEEPDEIARTGESKARVSSDQVEVRVRASALSRAEEECAPVVCHLRSGERVCKPAKAATTSVTTSRRRREIPPAGGQDWFRREEEVYKTFFLSTFSIHNTAYSECP